jgi:nitroreductase
METLDTIAKRRSVRSFTNKPISKEIIEQLLKAAMAAPSAGNEQPWHFIVINERSVLDQIPKVHPYANMCLEAPAAIITCADTTLAKHSEMWVQDLSAAVENILLAVRALDLGAVWLGVHPNAERVAGIKKLFNLPASVTPFNIIPIGYTSVEQVPVERYKADRVHYNKW